MRDMVEGDEHEIEGKAEYIIGWWRVQKYRQSVPVTISTIQFGSEMSYLHFEPRNERKSR